MKVRIEITVDKDVLQVALEELQIAHNPPSITTNWQEIDKHRKSINSEEFGHYLVAENHIAIQTLPPSYARLPLFQLQPKIRETVLHELRHAHQYQVWPETRRMRMREGPYWLRDMEIDARAWGYKAAHQEKYRKLVTVRRHHLGKAVMLP